MRQNYKFKQIASPLAIMSLMAFTNVFRSVATIYTYINNTLPTNFYMSSLHLILLAMENLWVGMLAIKFACGWYPGFVKPFWSFPVKKHMKFLISLFLSDLKSDGIHLASS